MIQRIITKKPDEGELNNCGFVAQKLRTAVIAFQQLSNKSITCSSSSFCLRFFKHCSNNVMHKSGKSHYLFGWKGFLHSSKGRPHIGQYGTAALDISQPLH